MVFHHCHLPIAKEKHLEMDGLDFMHLPTTDDVFLATTTDYSTLVLVGPMKHGWSNFGILERFKLNV